MFYEPSTDTIYASTQEFRLAYPNTSFGDLVSEEECNAAGLFSIVFDAPPYDMQLQKLVELGPVLQDGKYVMQYRVDPADLTQEQRDAILLARYEAALTAHLDAVAQSRRYDNRVTCALRAGYPGPFQAEGAAFAAWMDQCNALGYQVLAEIRSGARQLPTIEEFIAMMPEMTWPDAS